MLTKLISSLFIAQALVLSSVDAKFPSWARTNTFEGRGYGWSGHGAGVNVYVIDSGADVNGVTEIPNFTGFEAHHHGSAIATAIKSIAPASAIYSLKITEGAKVFNEKKLIQAIRAAVNHGRSYSGGKIINFSGDMRAGNTRTLNCAIQKAFEAGFAFVAASGNNANKNVEFKNYRQFLVGSYNEYLNQWKDSSAGTNDLNGPNQAHDYARGTSVATAYTTGVLATAISQGQVSSSSPALQYGFLIANSKRSASGFRMLTSSSGAGFGAHSLVGDHCDAGTTLDTLVASASTTALGDLVTEWEGVTWPQWSRIVAW